MRAALIAPKGYESTVLRSDIHLALPLPELVDDEVYIGTYARARRRGDYIILDNGTAEGLLQDSVTIMRLARTIGAHEIVAPDVMGNAEKTRNMTRAFIRNAPNIDDYGVMGVAQGESWPDVHSLIRFFARHSIITAIGIPKVHVKKAEDEVRLRYATRILDEYGDHFKIHLLGQNRAYPRELIELQFPSEIRSTDSALPYKYAADDFLLSDINSETQPSTRWPTYFKERRQINQLALETNIETYLRWAKSNEG